MQRVDALVCLRASGKIEMRELIESWEGEQKQVLQMVESIKTINRLIVPVQSTVGSSFGP